MFRILLIPTLKILYKDKDMTIEEFNNLELDQEVFFIKKPNIKNHLTFTSGVDRFVTAKKLFYETDSYSYNNKCNKGDTWWHIKEAEGNKSASRSIHYYSIEQWYLSRDEALYGKICMMKELLKKCKAPSVKSQPAYKFKQLMQQKNVIKQLSVKYPELLV